MANASAQAAGASIDALRRHYDLGNEFYGLWLDPTLTYTCALWQQPDDTLEVAQLRKLDHHLGAVRAQGVGRILDIGCGWGSMLRRAVDEWSVSHAVGITLSEAQYNWLGAQAHPRCEVRLESWADHQPTEPYDALTSLCAIEHFARPGLSRAERVAVYREFFGRCHAWLRPGGRMALQCIVWGSRRPDAETLHDLLFMSEEIFPESEWPKLAELAHGAERRFEIESVRDDRADYVRTLEAWHQGLDRNRALAIAAVGEERVNIYARYLQVARRLFAEDYTGLVRMVLRRA